MVTKLTRLCCEIVCFLSIRGLKLAFADKQFQIPAEVFANLNPKTDCLTMILGRYFSPHHRAIDRDDLDRPICPGPLSLNHCLWKYARSYYPRRILKERGSSVPTTFFETQRFIFGSTPQLQDRRWRDDVHAYLCLHFPADIHKRVYMTREYHNDTLQHSNTWLETVILG